MKNFIYTLVDYIDKLELEYPVKVGIFDENPSLMVRPVTGSEVIHEYMNGMTDIRLPFEVSIKSKDQEVAFNVLNEVMNHIRDIGKFLNDEKDGNELILLNLELDQIPVFGASEDGYFYYTSKLTVDLTNG